MTGLPLGQGGSGAPEVWQGPSFVEREWLAVADGATLVVGVGGGSSQGAGWKLVGGAAIGSGVSVMFVWVLPRLAG